ncbi:MAG: LPPG:FO 2-phospho-L-lactate transferase, LPPG:FO 2-phospho-L-lactate transferase [Candidatus Dadabacteria bacterium CSP1-2]|nr:MAG: LPPG:FO 2-phospho-L-lactate transferase, LPPG:FO 2-phospho-L-lactate transferase [Candidatus Dadabacteria bacterium CSP1-2]
MITTLGGGVGAAKFLKGLSRIPEGELFTTIVNTGDDIAISGLRISPDIDTIIYRLSGLVDKEKGWGIKEDTFHGLEALGRFGVETWFKLGDKDLATHIYRTYLRNRGFTPSEITNRVAKAFGINNIIIIPMTDDEVETWIVTDEGEMHIQEYLVKRGMKPKVKGISIKGIENARPAPGVIQAIEEARGVIVCPSNPIISIGPILQVKGIREALKRTQAKVIAISPLVGGAPLKGPADKLMRGLGLEVSSTQVAKLYNDFIDEIVIDEKDAFEADTIRSIGIKPVVADTVMSNDEKAERLARWVLERFEDTSI